LKHRSYNSQHCVYREEVNGDKTMIYKKKVDVDVKWHQVPLPLMPAALGLIKDR